MARKFQQLFGWLRTAAVAALFLVLVTFLMLFLAGRFSRKIGAAAAQETQRAIPPGASLVAARVIAVPVTESAVGTMQAVHETTLASRILSRVVEIDLHAGQPVKRGDVLVRLDDTDLQSRLKQAQAMAQSAQAAHDQAETEEKRLGPLVGSVAISRNEYDTAVTTLRRAEAEMQRAQEAIVEAKAVLSYATINSPIDGVVVDKKVDTGDTVAPGQPLLSIYDPHRMQLVADVRESLARRLQVGQRIDVRLDAPDQICPGQVSEVVPDAQSASRTFQVKVTGSYPANLYTGTFGRIYIPLQSQDVLVIPRTAVRHVGQLELVDVADNETSQRRAVRTGQILGDDCQVLSGLQAGEKVIVPAGTPTRPSSPEVSEGGRP